MNTLFMMKKSLAIAFSMALTLVILLSTVGSALAKDNRVAAGKNLPVAPSQAQGPTDPAELEAFLDDLLENELEEYNIAGAAISVVKDGKLFFAKGYGYADVENGIPVDPEQTLFRTGSVGKLFTWTAVMQLVEQGKLDLDADVNTYLDFRIPDTYPQPVTIRSLLTHTSGLEDRWYGSVVSDPKDMMPASEFLASHMTARVRPPGYAGYSNYNAILAGYIVARVSGQNYEDYIQEKILDPLGMVHSTVRSPIPANLRPLLSMGYEYEEGVFQAVPEYFPQPAGMPSGFHMASVTDMARFMIAHLQDGRYSDAKIAEARILKEITAQQMHSTQYTPDPRLLGIDFGFFDFSENGQRTIGHSGYAPTTYTLLLLLPDQNLGVYVAYNSRGGGALTNQHSGFQKAFFDHYYPAPAVAPIQPPADFAERAGRFVGSYRYSSSPLKVIRLFGAYTLEIGDPGDGTLLFTIEGRKVRFVEVEPLYFRQVDGPLSAVFREDDRGRITHMFTDFVPHFATIKLGWYETAGFNMALILGCVLIFLSMIPVGLIRLIRDRRSSGERKPASRVARKAHWIILAISVLNVLFVAGVYLWGDVPNELLGPRLILKILLGLGVLSAVLTIGALACAGLAWKNRYWGIAGRAYYTLVTIAAVAFVWFLNYWNLLGWRF